MSENIAMLLYAGLMLLSVFVSSIAQVMLKKAAQKEYESVLKEYLNPQVIAAYGIFFSATLLTIFAYRGIPLSMGGILESTGYIYVTFFGVTIFHEKLTKKKLLALGMIIAGVVVYSL